MLEDSDKEWLRRLLGEGVRFDEPMAKYTYFRIGGPADVMAQPDNKQQLRAILKWSQQTNIPYFLLGGGTNLLVRDGGIRGLVLHLGKLSETLTWDRQQEQVIITAGAAVSTKRLCALALKHGWQGMNFALGIPGTLGGAIIMNAGTAHGCMADVLDTVTVMTATGQEVILPRESLIPAYRCLQMPSGITGDAAFPAVLMGAQMTLMQGDREQLRQQAQLWMQGRSRRQPSWKPSAGSFFKNPSKGLPAGRLIDDAGLKGFRIGGAQVSPKHANFIVNHGGATAADVLSIAAKIQETVKSRFGVALTPEVRIVGEEKTGA